VSPARTRLSPVLVLGILGVLTFALIPLQINTIYSGLPAHPLFLHVPVILIPVAGLAALALAARPVWWTRHGVWVTAVAVVALGATNLTIGAGEKLRDDLFGGSGSGGFGGGGFGGGASSLVEQHASAADTLRIFVILFTAALIVTLAVYRADTGIGPLDRVLGEVRGHTAATAVLRLAVAVLAVLSLYYVFHTGDLGAKAVWQGRIHGAGGFGGGGSGGGVGSLFGGGGGGGG
jgi:hypothetical protein